MLLLSKEVNFSPENSVNTKYQYISSNDTHVCCSMLRNQEYCNSSRTDRDSCWLSNFHEFLLSLPAISNLGDSKKGAKLAAKIIAHDAAHYPQKLKTTIRAPGYA